MKQTVRSQRWIAGMAVAVFALPTGCVGGKEFRETAFPAIHTGVSSILNGLVDGVFAAIEVDPETARTTSG